MTQRVTTLHRVQLAPDYLLSMVSYTAGQLRNNLYHNSCQGPQTEEHSLQSVCLHQGDGLDHQHQGGGGDLGVGDVVAM